MKIYTKEQREEFKSSLKEFFNFEDTETSKHYEYSKEFETIDELHSSEEFKRIYKGYENVMSDHIYYDKKNQFEFIGAYVVGEDVYKKYKADGLTFFKKIKIHGCISNSPFNEVLIVPGFINIIRRRWENSKDNRRMLRKTEYTTITTCL